MLVIYPKLEQIMHFRKSTVRKNRSSCIHTRELQEKNMVTFALLRIAQPGDSELQDLPLNCSSHLLWAGESQALKLSQKDLFSMLPLLSSDKEEEGEARLETIEVKKKHRDIIRVKEWGDRAANNRTVWEAWKRLHMNRSKRTGEYRATETWHCS